MSTTTSEEDLNSFFQSMSEFTQEENDWNLNSKFLISKVKLLSELTSQGTNPVVLDVFGSSAEDLKFCSPNDIGDIDIMVYPVSEKTQIDADLAVMETVEGVPPVYVRLRATNHPVLQHCTTDNFEYVSTSALKTFHPALFGEKTNFLNLIPRTFSIVDQLDLDNMTSVVGANPMGPSFQLDVKHSWGSVTEQVKDHGNVFDAATKTDAFRNLLEWFAVTLNPQRVFTEEHSACIDDFLAVVQDGAQSFKENPSVTGYLDMLNHLLSREHMSEIKQKVEGIDQRALVADESSQYPGAAAADEHVSGSASTACSFPSLPSGVRNSNEAALNDHVTKNTTDDNRIGNCTDSNTERFHQGGQLCDSAGDNPTDSIDKNETDAMADRGQTNCGKDLSQVVPENATPESKGSNDKNITVSDVQNMLTKQLVDGIFAKASNAAQIGSVTKQPYTPNTKTRASASQTLSEDHSKTVFCGIDLVPALHGQGWPKVARAWSTRARKWPSQEIISNVLDSGFHVVVKSPSGNIDHADEFFRLSFSRAELILSGELNSVQRECYRCLKRYYRYVIEGRQGKVITSYSLKTVLLWTVEETGSEFWSEDKRATCVLMLLEKLHKYLESKFLPLYFIPEVNLLENAIIDHPKELEYITKEFRKIYENPRMYSINEKGEHDQRKTTQENAATSDQEDVSNTNSNTEDNSSSCAKKQFRDNTNAEKARDTRGTGCQDQNPSGSSIVSVKKPLGTDSTSLFLKYEEFHKIYQEVYKELIDMVLQGNASHYEDPVIETIVSNLQAMASKMEDPKAGMTVVFEHSSESVYTLHVMHPGRTARQRILSALKGYSEIFSFAVAQDDLLAEGNEHLIVARMLHSNSFDVSSALMPNSMNVMREIVKTVETPISPVLQQGEDEIPLD